MSKESHSDIDWSLLGNEHVVNQIDQWVLDRKIGYRLAYNMWRLNNEADVTSFLLRWHNAVIDL